MSKTVIILVGPKGSGKTHIGTVFERRAGISFLRVEPIWLALQEGQDGWDEVERAIDGILTERDAVVIESLGGSDGFERLRSNLMQKYQVKFVRIVAPLKVCLQRVRSRDNSNHIPISDEKVEQYNRLAVKVSLPWEIELQNDPPLSDGEILQHLSRIGCGQK